MAATRTAARNMSAWLPDQHSNVITQLTAQRSREDHTPCLMDQQQAEQPCHNRERERERMEAGCNKPPTHTPFQMIAKFFSEAEVSDLMESNEYNCWL